MLVHIKHILGEAELRKVQELLNNASFRDGKFTAGLAAQAVKSNQEVADEKIISSSHLRIFYVHSALRLFHPDPQTC